MDGAPVDEIVLLRIDLSAEGCVVDLTVDGAPARLAIVFRDEPGARMLVLDDEGTALMERCGPSAMRVLTNAIARAHVGQEDPRSG